MSGANRSDQEKTQQKVAHVPGLYFDLCTSVVPIVAKHQKLTSYFSFARPDLVIKSASVRFGN